MTKLGVDVSKWNGQINWKSVADYGKVNFSILRITEKDNIVDSTFEPNYQGCIFNNIPVGVYKYSYATSLSQIKEEANIVIKVLNGRKLDWPVFLDIEDKCQENLSKSTMESFIEAFREIIEKAGYRFSIYCSAFWYKTKLPESAKKYDCWLAAYPANDDGTMQERLRPTEAAVWQYSSKAKIPGINGVVDRNIAYKDLGKVTIEKPNEGDDKIMEKDLWTQTEELLQSQVGYLEKASNANLDSKTGNAGFNNYQKYSRDVNALGLMGCQAQPWCSTYQFWINWKIFGKEKALEIMGNGFYNCNSVKNHAKTKGTWHSEPKLGALIIFRNGAHIGRVIKVTSTHVYTNEGNTSSGGVNNVEANGGCVAAPKQYTRDYSGIDGYVWIDYGVSSSTPPVSPTTNPYNKTTKWVGTVTADSLNVRTGPGTDNSTCSFSPLKKNTVIDVCDTSADKKWYYIKYENKYGFVSAEYVKEKATSSTPIPPVQIFTIDGVKFPELANARKPSGDAVGVVQSILNVPVTNKWDAATVSAIKSFKASVGLPATSASVGEQTWIKLMEKLSKQVKNNA